MTAEPACYGWPLPIEMCDDPYRALVAWQAGRCAMCGHAVPGRALSEDHDHATGLTRGFLCRGCNLHEGHCSSRTCACSKWRGRSAVDLLGVTIEYTGWDSSREGFYRRKGETPPSLREVQRRVMPILSALIQD